MARVLCKPSTEALMTVRPCALITCASWSAKVVFPTPSTPSTATLITSFFVSVVACPAISAMIGIPVCCQAACRRSKVPGSRHSVCSWSVRLSAVRVTNLEVPPSSLRSHGWRRRDDRRSTSARGHGRGPGSGVRRSPWHPWNFDDPTPTLDGPKRALSRALVRCDTLDPARPVQASGAGRESLVDHLNRPPRAPRRHAVVPCPVVQCIAPTAVVLSALQQKAGVRQFLTDSIPKFRHRISMNNS